MNVLIIGGGGREHALAWKIAQSPLVKRLYCAPGNPGIAAHATCAPVTATDIPGLLALAKVHAIDLTVVGPEDPLAHGLVDQFEAAGFTAFGPSAKAAQLEASKAFAKHIMAKYGIPTAEYAEFSNAEEAVAYVKQKGAPIVVKADGLAAGKGVTVASDVDTAIAAIRAAMVDHAFGQAGRRVVIEERLVGEEASILAFTDGKTVVPMPPSQDHKAVFDNDEGPNTGGMGAYAPAPVVSEALLEEIVETVLKPCVQGMANEGIAYRGVLYAGLMITESGPKVIEFNCRFGDPETQVVLPLLQSDLVPVLAACCDGTLDQVALDWAPCACASVVMTSKGYPGPYSKGKPIEGIGAAEKEGVSVFHAGTKKAEGTLVTHGGRVLNVTATDATLPAALQKAYAGVENITFEGAHFRRDIGRKALERLGMEGSADR